MSVNTASSGIEQDRNPSTQLTDENQDHVTHANTSVVDLEAINYTDEDAKEVVDLTKDISGFIDLTEDDISLEASQQPSGKQNRRKRKRNQSQNTGLPDDCVEVLPIESSDSQSINSSQESVNKRIICPICMDDSSHIVQDSRHLVATTCGHVFCNRCLEESIKVQQKCPTCRKNVNNKKYHKLFL